MPLTPNSAANPYITAQDLLARVDWRTVAQLVSDDNTLCGFSSPTPMSAIIAVLEGTPNATTNVYAWNLNKAMAAASGRLESAVLIGQRYQPTDLQGLTGVSLEYLKAIVSGLTIDRLYKRRDGRSPSPIEKEAIDDAKAAIENLQGGHEIFSFVETQENTLPQNYQLQAQDIVNRGFMTIRYRRAFGARTNILGPLQ